MKQIKRDAVVRGMMVRIQLLDGSFRIGPVYGISERFCMGARIDDKDVVLRVWEL